MLQKLSNFIIFFLMNTFITLFSSIPFGELEISNTTAIIILVISVFIFIAVGISSFKLIQSAFDPEEDLVAVLMTQVLGSPWPASLDFESLVYAAIDD